MGDRDSRDGRRAGGGVLGPVGTRFVEFSELCKNRRCIRAVMSVLAGRRMRFYVHKT